MRKEFAKKFIEGKTPEALERALNFYENSRNEAEKILQSIEDLPAEIVLSSLDAFPPQTRARLLLYFVLRGEDFLREKALEMAGYLDHEGPDSMAIGKIKGEEGKETTHSRYLNFLRKSFVPYIFIPCRLKATASIMSLKDKWDLNLLRSSLWTLEKCPHDFVRTPYLEELMEACGSNISSVVEEIIDFQRKMLFDFERAKVLNGLTRVLRVHNLLNPGMAEKIIFASKEIETKAFRFWLLMEISKEIAMAGYRDMALSISRKIENPFWKGAISYELVEEKDEIDNVEDPFWNLLIQLKTHPQEQKRIIEEFISNEYIPQGIKLPSLEIVANFLPQELKNRINEYLEKLSWRGQEGEGGPSQNKMKANLQEFISLPVEERDREALWLAENVDFSHPLFGRFLEEILYHPEAVDILLSRKLRGEGKEEAEEILKKLS